jgi:hypothetical protein
MWILMGWDDFWHDPNCWESSCGLGSRSKMQRELAWRGRRGLGADGYLEVK